MEYEDHGLRIAPAHSQHSGAACWCYYHNPKPPKRQDEVFSQQQVEGQLDPTEPLFLHL